MSYKDPDYHKHYRQTHKLHINEYERKRRQQPEVKQHIKEWHKEWKENNLEHWKELEKKHNQDFYQQHKEQVKKQTKKYRETHKKELKIQKQEYTKTHKEKRKQYCQIHIEKRRELHKEWIRKNPERAREFWDNHRTKRQLLGHVPLNKYFEGATAHHIDKEHIIYIPEELHKSVWHCLETGKGMSEINNKVFEWLQSEQKCAMELKEILEFIKQKLKI